MTTQELAAWLREELGRVHEKLDEVMARTGTIDVTLAEQAKDIAYHIRRTDALETRVEQVASDLKPVKDHVARLKGIAWFLGAVSAAVGLAATMWKFLV